MKHKISFAIRLLVAIILFQSLYFKFGSHEQAIHIFTTLGVEPMGTISSWWHWTRASDWDTSSNNQKYCQYLNRFTDDWCCWCSFVHPLRDCCSLGWTKWWRSAVCYGHFGNHLVCNRDGYWKKQCIARTEKEQQWLYEGIGYVQRIMSFGHFGYSISRRIFIMYFWQSNRGRFCISQNLTKGWILAGQY